MDLRGCVILQPRYPGRRLCQMSSERKQTPGLFQTKKIKIFEKKCCMIELKLLYTYKVLYMVST